MKDPLIKIRKWLYPLSWGYGLITTVRNKLFDWHILTSKSYDLPIICVGNLTVGGTGKTPHTEYLIKLLKENYNIAVLSRGYKRKTKGFLIANEQSSALSVGDEPFQIKNKFKDITVAVDADRCNGVEQVMKLKEPAIDTILLDDAFQHRYIKAGLNILLTDYNRLICEDTLLPAGNLREAKSGKSRAQIVIVTKCPSTIKPIDFNIIAKRLNLYPFQDLFFSTFQYKKLKPIFVAPNEESKEKNLSELIGADVLLLTGIVVTEQLSDEIKCYAKHVEELNFEDHHEFTKNDITLIEERFNQLESNNKYIVTTEKDAARLKHLSLSDTIKNRIYALPIEVKILQNKDKIFNQKIIDYVKKDRRNSSIY